jgi:hypothetical protein
LVGGDHLWIVEKKSEFGVDTTGLLMEAASVNERR